MQDIEMLALIKEHYYETLTELQEENTIEITVSFSKELWDYDLIDFEPQFSQFVFEKMVEKIKGVIEEEDEVDNASEDFYKWVKSQKYNLDNFGLEVDWDNQSFTIKRNYYF